TPVTPPVTGTFDLSATYKVTSDWRTGFTGSISLKNTGTLAVSGWTLEFDLDAKISLISGATVVSHVGNHYVVKDSGWDASLPVGQSISLEIVASRADGVPGPAIASMSNVVFTSGAQKKSFSSVGPNG
ncbi:cellulose binding domain-containing protein, partial [Singulisphaera rosea]